MQPRPGAIMILAILCWLAGAVNVVGALQWFGHLPTLGSMNGGLLENSQLGGWLLAAMAIISLFLAGGLWATHAWARRAVAVVAGLNILVALVTQVDGGMGWINALPAVLLNIAILGYGRAADVQSTLNG